MNIARQRFLLSLSGLSFLLFLPFLVGIHLYKSHLFLEKSYHELLSSFVKPDLPVELGDVDRRINKVVSASSLEAIPQIPIVSASLLPQTMEASSPVTKICSPFVGHEKKWLGKGCASIVGGPQSHGAYEEVEKAKLAQIGYILRRAYVRLANKESSSVLFVYAVIPLSKGKVAVFYPATYFDPKYDFTKRQWYSAKKRVGELYVSPLYRDYVTNKLTLSVLRRSNSPESRVTQSVIDLTISDPKPAFGPYLLNAIICLLALLAYWRFYLARQLKFQLYLLLSTVTLFCSYLALTINEFLAISGFEATASEDSLMKVISFLPTGALLATASDALFPRRSERLARRLGKWYSLELLAAILSVAFDSKIYTTIASCLALSYFGVALHKKRVASALAQATSINPVPDRLSLSAGITYIVWGLTQFTLLLGAFDSPVRRALLGFLSGPPPAWSEFMLASPGIFSYLLYAKALAIFFTILYFSAEMELSYKKKMEISRDMVYARVLPGGQLVEIQNLPEGSSLSTGQDFVSSLADAEDREEIAYSLRNSLRLDEYLCTVRGLFHSQLVRLTIYPSDFAESPVFVTIQRLEEGLLPRYVNASVSELLEIACKRLNEIAASPGDLRASVLSAAESLANQRARLSTLLPSRVFEDRRTSLNDLWVAFREKFEKFSVQGGGTFRSLAPDYAKLPRRLRINEEVFRFILDCIEEVLIRNVRSGGVEAELSGPQFENPKSSMERVAFVLRLPFDAKVLDAYNMGRAAEQGVYDFGSIGSIDEKLLIMTQRLASVFCGNFKISEIERMLALEVRLEIAYLRSSGGPVK